MAQVRVGAPLSDEQETDLRRRETETLLAEAEQAAEAIERKLAGMQESLDDRRAEIARLRAEMED